MESKPAVVIATVAKDASSGHTAAWDRVTKKEAEWKAGLKAQFIERQAAVKAGRPMKPIYVPAAPTRSEQRAEFRHVWSAARDAGTMFLKAHGFKYNGK